MSPPALPSSPPISSGCRSPPRGFYPPRALGTLLSDTPNLPVAGAFYLLYVVGIVVFAVYPAADSRSLWMLIGRAVLLGAVAYGTYDITSLSTIRGWPIAVSVVDIAWGMTATTIGAVVGYAALRFSNASAAIPPGRMSMALNPLLHVTPAPLARASCRRIPIRATPRGESR